MCEVDAVVWFGNFQIMIPIKVITLLYSALDCGNMYGLALFCNDTCVVVCCGNFSIVIAIQVR